MRQADLFQSSETLFVYAGTCVYFKSFVPILSESYDPKELKELVAIERQVLAKGALHGELV